MMDKQEKYLSDILSAIELIEDFLKNIYSYEDYQNDLKTKSAVERQLGIIGEAVNNYSKTNPQINLAESAFIISFRNRLIHAYDSIDDSIVWVIINRHLTKLKNEVQEKLRQYFGNKK